jgi:DNA-binding GntR family transcriptional regulator
VVDTSVTERRRHDNGPVLVGDAAYATIRRDIVRCALPPGEQVSKATLAERYGVSMGVLRRVLDRLAQDGLVQSLPREGYRISPITLGDVQDLMAARLAVEPVAARLAAGKLEPETLERLHALDDVFRRMVDIEAHEAANLEFHLTIARACGIERLGRIVTGLLEEWERLAYFGGPLTGHVRKEAEEHETVVAALATGDAGAAEAAMAAHLESSRQVTLAALSGNPEFRAVVLTTA